MATVYKKHHYSTEYAPMSDFRRAHVPGGTFFFTLKTEANAPVFVCPKAIALLGQILREALDRWPFQISSLVLLPDHLHTLWVLPPGDTNYSTRWGWLKKEFTKRYLLQGGGEQAVSASRTRYRRRGVWQRRYWEHTIQDVKDYESHFDYIHWNPVKHGYVQCPSQWKYSTFHKWVKKNVYPANWGCGQTIGNQNRWNRDFGE